MEYYRLEFLAADDDTLTAEKERLQVIFDDVGRELKSRLSGAKVQVALKVLEKFPGSPLGKIEVYWALEWKGEREARLTVGFNRPIDQLPLPGLRAIKWDRYIGDLKRFAELRLYRQTADGEVLVE